jgi:hypothetical protein
LANLETCFANVNLLIKIVNNANVKNCAESKTHTRASQERLLAASGALASTALVVCCRALDARISMAIVITTKTAEAGQAAQTKMPVLGMVVDATFTATGRIRDPKIAAAMRQLGREGRRSPRLLERNLRASDRWSGGVPFKDHRADLSPVARMRGRE